MEHRNKQIVVQMRCTEQGNAYNNYSEMQKESKMKENLTYMLIMTPFIYNKPYFILGDTILRYSFNDFRDNYQKKSHTRKRKHQSLRH